MSLRFNSHPFYEAPNKVIGGGGDMTVDDMADFLADESPSDDKIDLDESPGKTTTKDKDTTDKDGEKKGKKGAKESDKDAEPTDLPDDDSSDDTDPDALSDDDDLSTDDELQELVDETEEPTDDKLELVTPVRRREILKKYPELFKDFPYLEKAYYREQKFTEIFPTLEDAQIATEKSQVLDRFESDVMSGNTETILKTVREQDPRAFARIVDGYMSTLANVDERAYQHVIGNILKNTVFQMVKEGRASQNAALGQAAQIVNQFVFGTSEWTPPQNLAKDEPQNQDNTREQQIAERERALVQRQFDDTRNTLNNSVNNAIRSTISANIDPRNSMSDYVRRNAERDCEETLNRLISADTRFKVIIDRLWEAAYKSNFSQESVSRIKTAFKSKAKSLLPSVIKKARVDALRGTGKRVSDSDREPTQRRGPVTPERPRSQSFKGGKTTNPKEIPKGMSSIDFLNSD